jgi:hypothetical protein
VLDQDLNYHQDLSKGFVVYLFDNVTLSEIESTLSQFICINEEYSLNTQFKSSGTKLTSTQMKMANFVLCLDD